MGKLLTILLLIATAIDAFSGEIVNDVTQLNPILVDKVITPTNVAEVQKAVIEHSGKISIGGGRYSMGGQTATEHALQIDMRKMNKVVSLDVKAKKITVQAGIRWRDIQDVIDKHDLSIKIMQTYSNFTVGGALSVNCHGRYVGQGPLVRSVDSVKVVLADGTAVEASPAHRPEIFYGVIGGYGALGVIVEATLQLVDNEKVERTSKVVAASDYLSFFRSEVRDNPQAVFHNGDIYPPEFEKVNAVTWLKTDKPLTETERLIPRNVKYTFQPAAISALTSMPMGRKIRSSIVDPLLFSKPKVVWRNHEASYDVAELEPASRKDSTFVLQEYFVPVNRFGDFVPKMRDVFKKYKVEVFNVSIRHALPDPGTYLAWASEEVFAFVVYYKQGTKPQDRQIVAKWTREMISEVLSVGGRYYLPYQIWASDGQFHKAYPRYNEFFALKKQLDPNYKFRNKLWDRYYQSMPDPIAQAVSELKQYKRGEEQTYLGLPEWYIVFNGDEYADFLKRGAPGDFPYFSSAMEFWNLKSQVKDIIKDQYPYNWGYNVMLWVIGTSYSVELVIKGLYEKTVGRLTEAISGDDTHEDKLIQKFHKEYADFVHVYPWYEFLFWPRLKQFWSETPFWGEFWLRKWERKFLFTVEYSIKAAYASLIKAGTQLSYEPEATEIYAVVNDPLGELKSFPKVVNVADFDTYHLIKMPRYDDFRELSKEFGEKSIRYVEIAGNRRIFMTAIVDKVLDTGLRIDDVIVGHSNVPTEPFKDRLLIATQVGSLGEVLHALKTAGAQVEHIFDY